MRKVGESPCQSDNHAELQHNVQLYMHRVRTCVCSTAHAGIDSAFQSNKVGESHFFHMQ